jgi:hypothetical protein
MIPNYFKMNYLNIGWGFAFLGFNIYRLDEIVRDRTTTAASLGFTPAELAVYEAKFQRHLTPRKFHALLQCAEWREVKKRERARWTGGEGGVDSRANKHLQNDRGA